MRVSDPQNPQDVGFIDTPGQARGVAVAGGVYFARIETAAGGATGRLVLLR